MYIKKQKITQNTMTLYNGIKSNGFKSISTRRYEISNKQWNQIKDIFSRAKTGRPPKDNRIIFNAILWLARSGAALADIPE